MIRTFVLHFLLYLFGVFDDVESYEVKSVSVMEGESVTLHTDVAEIQRDDEIEWRFNSIRIAKANIPEYDNAERFRDRLKLDRTGSLTITNTRTTDSGDYKVSATIKNTESIKRFSVTVYAPVSNIPVITSDISQCCSSAESASSPKCVLVCSVMNLSRVTLSWYRGNSLLSSISALEKKCVSDLSISLSLPLEVEYQDNNTYSCVVNNPISTKTKHVCITDLCRLCSDEVLYGGGTEAVIRLVVTAVVGLAAAAAFIVLLYDIRSRRVEQERHQTLNDGSDILKQE
uniref:Ig-like domain-containing protein n=1 Tax=Cyprinus carpio TaxID=7962 RepID=A0A8C2EH03_CYPCA